LDVTRLVGILTERDPLKAMSLLMPEPPLRRRTLFLVTGSAMMHAETARSRASSGATSRHTKLRDPVFLLAVGWLAREGKVRLERAGQSLRIELTER
jgi:hypothetical protein